MYAVRFVFTMRTCVIGVVPGCMLHTGAHNCAHVTYNGKGEHRSRGGPCDEVAGYFV